jgi:glucose-1-phosphate thymidylyltransferase
MEKNIDHLVGLIPMAGRATRLGRLPFSKELFPIGIDGRKGPMAVSTYLIDCMRHASVADMHLVIRNGKWDIPAYYGGGKDFGFNPCFHVTQYEYGVPFTIYQAYPFVKDKTVVFGFPDIVFSPLNAFDSLIVRLEDEKTSVVLGSTRVKNPQKWDMVDIDKDGVVNKIKIKPKENHRLKYNWFIAAWKPAFTLFLKDFVETCLREHSPVFLENNEYHLGDVLNAAIESGLIVRSVAFRHGKSLDIGTVEDLNLAPTYV